MHDFIEQYEHDGLRVTIRTDDDPMDPEEGDCPVLLFHNHDQFAHASSELPFYVKRSDNKHSLPNYDLMTERFLDMFLREPQPPERSDYSDDADGEEYYAAEVEAYNDQLAEWKEEKAGWVVYLVDAYIHSGVHLALSDSIEAARLPDRQWDVSQCGAILIRKDPEWWGECDDEGYTFTDKASGIVTKHSWVEVAQSHIDLWNMYLGGEVYGYTVEEFSCRAETVEIEEVADHEYVCTKCRRPAYRTLGEWVHVDDPNWEEIDSCWGFYGLDDVKEQAESSAKHYAERSTHATPNNRVTA